MLFSLDLHVHAVWDAVNTCMIFCHISSCSFCLYFDLAFFFLIAVKGVLLPSPQVVIDFVLYPVHLSHAVMMSTIQLLSY